MRSVFVGMTLVVACFYGVALAQNPQRDDRTKASATDPQGRADRAGQPDRPGQPGRPAQADTTGRIPAADATRQPAAREGVAHATASSSDQQIAAFIFGSCHGHIELSKFGQSKAQSEETRQFAERMVRDHQPGCEKMQQLAGNLAVGLHAGAPHAAAQPGIQPRAGVEVTARQGAGGMVDWLTIHKQIGQQCLTSTKQALAEHQGAEFDQAFMGHQIVAHMEMIDKLTVLRNYASGELRQDIDKSLQMANEHLQAAKQIKEQLKDRPAERVTRNPKAGTEAPAKK